MCVYVCVPCYIARLWDWYVDIITPFECALIPFPGVACVYLNKGLLDCTYSYLHTHTHASIS